MKQLEMDKSSFAYSLTLKLNDLVPCKLKTEMACVTDLSINSRSFDNYFDCSNSVRELMDNVIQTINDGVEDKAHQYMLITEVNPIYSGVDTKSRDWIAGELARLWVFDAQQEEDNTILAIGQARVFMVAREPLKELH